MSGTLSAPQVSVELDGLPLPASTQGALVAVRVDQALSVPARVELAFADPPGPLSGVNEVEPGARATVRVDEAPALIDADVTGVERGYSPDGDRRVTVRGYDPLDRLRREQRSEVHRDTDLVRLAARLAASAGLDVACDHDVPPVGRLLQCQRTDLDLLRTEAERLGLYIAVRGRTLHLLSLAEGGAADEGGRAAGGGSAMELVLGTDLLDATVERVRAAGPVSVRGWDPTTGAAVEGEAGEPRRPGGRLAGGGSEPTRWLSGLTLRDEGHAAGRAGAESERRAAGSVVLSGTARGSEVLRPGVSVVARGLDAPETGPFVVTSASHRIDATRGYRTSFTTRPPERSETDAGHVLTLGEVVDVDDPRGAGRVRVSLSAFEELETDWLAVVTAGAGEGKGIVSNPDVGDRVAVLIPPQDPGLGVVLGGLFGLEPLPEPAVADGRSRRTSIVTAGGLRLVLCDDRRTLRLEDASGTSLEFGPESVALHAAGPLGITAAGHPIRIAGDRVDFERE